MTAAQRAVAKGIMILGLIALNLAFVAKPASATLWGQCQWNSTSMSWDCTMPCPPIGCQCASPADCLG